MSALSALIARRIRRLGPMDVAEYMTMCLLHPEHGYYTTRDPLGRGGDFTTAPEISQMFGEMLALPLLQAWQDQHRPAPFALVEPGPGRGTLMADILRTARALPGFLDAAEILLVEASPTLRKAQAEALQGHAVRWLEGLDALPERPLFLIANEFFDALPIRQYVRVAGGWRERLVALAGEEDAAGLTWALSPRLLPEDAVAMPEPVPEGAVVETHAAAEALVRHLAGHVARFGGLVLIVDYGGRGGPGDTLQAVQGHHRLSPLADPGRSDLSAHVDFAGLARAARDSGAAVSGITPQGVLLERLGITARAQALARKLSGDALESHIAAHRRLTHPEEMGSLFKALAIHPRGTPLPAGFDADAA